MEIWQAIILAIIQGITEWLPISSSGHLVLIQEFFNIEASLLFDILLHMGSLLALLIIFRKDILNLISFKKGYRGLAFLLLISTILTVLVVLIFREFLIKIFNNTLTVGIGLIITSLLLFSTKFAKEKKKNISLKDSILIGIMQGIAFIPGISRSGSTISTAMIRGVNREQAARYSFLLFIPAVLGAFFYQISSLEKLEKTNLLMLGTLISFIVSYAAIKLLLKIINKGKFHYFAYYCLILGLITIIISVI